MNYAFLVVLLAALAGVFGETINVSNQNPNLPSQKIADEFGNTFAQLSASKGGTFGMSGDGTPYGAAFGNGYMSSGPAKGYELNGGYLITPGESDWGIAKTLNFTNLTTFSFGALFSVVMYMACNFCGAALKSTTDLLDTTAVDDKKEEKNKTEEVKEEKKARRRREVKADEELGRMAAIVLSAVESGECLQKTICQLGAGFGGKKNHVALKIMDTLIPATLQTTSYYTTFRKAMRGEGSCERFRCGQH